MSEKKNIDRLFQEKFKDFEADPPEYVWQNIHDTLQEKKKRRVIPLWWRYGGVAAVLVLGTLFTLPYFGGVNNGQNPVVTAPTQNTAPGTTITAPRVIQDDARVSDGNDAIQYNDNAVAGTGGSSPNGDKTTGNDDNKVGGQKAHGKINKPDNAIATGTDNNAIAGTHDKPVSVKQRKPGTKHNGSGIADGADNNAIAGTDNKATTAKQRTPGTKRAAGVIKTDNQSAVATVGSGKNNRHKGGNDGNIADKNSDLNKSGQNNNNNNAGQIGNNHHAVADGATGRDAQNNKAGGVNGNIVVIDSITNHAIAEAIIDTTKVKPENELEKLLQEQQEGKKDEQVADNSGNKWSIKPQVAPVFYNSLSQGSPIDAQFASNAKSYDNDLSVGVGINYSVNKKLRIRSGINTVNLNYSTQGVEFYASLEGGTNNVSATAKSANIVVQAQGSTPGINPTNAFSSQLSSNNALAGSMVQQTGYVELPVEMSYALLDKKFGIEVIGGVSTLFLNQNSVSVISTQGLSTRVGEAQNLNNIHFSTNVGVGFRYRFFKAFEASFEPTFKYQVNTFSRDAGNFKPYFVGLYSGISFSF